MKVFTATSDEQEMRVRPRQKITSVVLYIRNEASDTTSNYSLTGTYSGGFLVLGVEHGFEEGEQYELWIEDTSDNLLWRGKGYCTDQTPATYKLNNGILTA